MRIVLGRFGRPAPAWLVAFLLTLSPSLFPAAAGAHEALTVPSRTRGITYEGLTYAASGPCRGGYVVADSIPGIECTHGPDPAPLGLDVSNPPAISSLSPGPDALVGEGVDCIGDGASGPRVEAIYAHAVDEPDNYSTAAPVIAAILGEMTDRVEESAAETGGVRTIRFTTEGCEPVVRNVTLTPEGDDSLGATASELAALGFDSPARDYLVFTDADVYCGIGYVDWQYARVDTGCWEYAALHEVTHNFGAVDLSAPNTSGGFHCTDESDVMCYSDSPNFPVMRQICPGWHETLLDCNHDDYFSTAPPVGNFLTARPDLNTADSRFYGDVDGEPPVFLPGTPPGYTGSSYVVHAYNADDDECVYGEGALAKRVRLFCIGYRGERTEDVTGALLAIAGGSTSATLRVVATDRGGGNAVGFTVIEDGAVVLSEEQGQAGVSSAGLLPGAPDPITGWPVFYEGAVTANLASATLTGPLDGAAARRCTAAASHRADVAGRARRLRRTLARMHNRLERQRAKLANDRSSAERASYRRSSRRYRRLLGHYRDLSREVRQAQRESRSRCRQA